MIISALYFMIIMPDEDLIIISAVFISPFHTEMVFKVIIKTISFSEARNKAGTQVPDGTPPRGPNGFRSFFRRGFRAFKSDALSSDF